MAGHRAGPVVTPLERTGVRTGAPRRPGIEPSPTVGVDGLRSAKGPMGLIYALLMAAILAA